MGRSAVRQEIRRMRFEEVCGRYAGGRLSCKQAAELLGMSVRVLPLPAPRFSTW